MKADDLDSYRTELTAAMGADEAEAMLASVGVMLHGLTIGDWRRVFKGLWCIQETLRRVSGDDLPDYLAPPRPTP